MDGSSPGKGDKAGAFLWEVLSDLWNYAANRVPEISDSIVEIDRAMRLGFNWELGPFEIWDAAGVEPTVARMKKEGKPVAASVQELLASGQKSWYVDDPKSPAGRTYWDLTSASAKPLQVAAGVWSVTVAKKSNGVVKKNSGASLVDLGDGVGCIEFHSKMNALGADIITLIAQTLKPGGPGDNFDAFVITNDAVNFSVGANLMLLLMSVQEEEWDDVDLVIRQFQGMTQAIKFSPKPVVSAPFGLCLGGGTEIYLHAAARQPHAELYTGLVEVGVGLLPGGGGCKEMLLRALDQAAASHGKSSPESLVGSVEMMEAMKKAFETVATAKVATSAHEARGYGFLSDSDRITMNRERVLSDAKTRAMELARAGYEPPVPRTDIPAPGENLLAALKMGVHLMRQGDFITEYEVKLAGKIAEVLCGGNVTPGTPVSEQYILDLEREGFKSLCGERKTQERIQYTLKTCKTLRNLFQQDCRIKPSMDTLKSVRLIALAVSLSACISATAQTDAHAKESAPDVPDAIAIPAGLDPTLFVHASGDQIYTCKAAADGSFSWTLKGPDAELKDRKDKLVGQHSAGPTWKLKDGSEVTGKVAAKVDSLDPDSVPWLLLNVETNSKKGALANVTTIQRVHTHGGMPGSD